MPSGSDTYVQYNSSGAFAGSSNLTFNGTTFAMQTATVLNLTSTTSNIVTANVTTANVTSLTYVNATGTAANIANLNVITNGVLKIYNTANTQYTGLKIAAGATTTATFTLPSADGTSGQFLKTNGSGVLSFGAASAITWQSVQTTNFTASAGNGYPVNTTSAGITVTLPVSASTGDTIQIVDYAGTFGTNNLTINPNGLKIQSQTSNAIVSKNNEALTLTYIDSTSGWLISSAANEGTSAVSFPYSIDFLVVAGGGGAGYSQSAGGAGGFRTSTQTVSSGTVITVTVGDGGARASVSSQGSSGSNSSISGSGLTTITSAGGGGGGSGAGGGAASDVGLAGGSGGGACSNFPRYVAATGGAGNTPSTSPSQGNNGGNGASDEATWTSGGGGGGAGAVGTNGSSGGTPNGGIGATSSITGSSVYYAGGGGGTADNGGNGTGGSGGGGNGGNPAGTNGTANLGGGGGGSRASGQGGSGGKGVVILSVPTANYSGTSTGSPTITTSGTKTILQFNGSGSYTA